MSEVRPKKTWWDKQIHDKIRIYLYISYAEKLKTKNDAPKTTPWIDIALKWHVNSRRHRRPACSLHACMQGIDGLLQDAASCSRASTPGIDSCISMEVATLRATCSLHAGFMSIAFLKCRSYFSKCSLHFARITPVCSLRTTVCRTQQAACVLQEACMQGACISSR